MAEVERDLVALRRRLVVGPSAALARVQAALDGRAARVVPAAMTVLDREEASVAARRRLLAAFDPTRLLERGWTMTTDLSGQVIRSTSDLELGATIVTMLQDGAIRSTVTDLAKEED